MTRTTLTENYTSMVAALKVFMRAHEAYMLHLQHGHPTENKKQQMQSARRTAAVYYDWCSRHMPKAIENEIASLAEQYKAFLQAVLKMMAAHTYLMRNLFNGKARKAYREREEAVCKLIKLYEQSQVKQTTLL